MPSYWSKTLIPTARQVPADAEVPSHQLMLRAGMIRKLGSGSYSYLPLGLRVLHKITAIIRKYMNHAGAQEILMPTLQPIELWERTARREAYGENLFVVTDRHGRKQALGPTHEEIVTELASGYLASYRDLPQTFYQIQTKFRDEYRPRFGVLRSREFLMKDAYSFHLSLEGEGGLDETYTKQYDAYCRIFAECGLPYEIVEAEAGPIGGSASHEFMVPSPTGEDVILKSDKNNYAANVEKCEIGSRPSNLEGEAKHDLEKLHTPDCHAIEDVCRFFKKKLGSKLKMQNMLKTLVCGEKGHWVIAVVRGDHDLNQAKLRNVCGVMEMDLADENQAKEAGFAIGFVGPHAVVGRENVTIYIDPDAAQENFWVTGANETDCHVRHFNWQRDLIDQGVIPVIADIRNAASGDPSPINDGGVLQETQGIEVGHVFKLGDKYTKALDVTVLTEDNQRATPIMGCYGIGVNRIMASAIECEFGHDENGIIWPRNIAPFDVVITGIQYGGEVAKVALKLASQLEDKGMEVLIDDRDERPGVKFKDADLVGIPVRVIVGQKGLDQGQVEVKARNASNGPKGQSVAVEEALAVVLELLGSLEMSQAADPLESVASS